ncbi:PREDICTED: uncharacterized protein LOC104596180 [Nelumbo nucifera]|uniref:Uncharacterized protein LOC104596180 n=1 Tax=Nelumbo nucifera TaxID=4432 RepID=A0A1U7ZN41_NELNU|nr:PREDICTED: uncharacterized protein LOC104596180 [Nelumbo nucifera]
MEVEPEIQPLSELVAALEHATLMAKKLPSTTASSQVFQVYSSLQNAHHHLTAFLGRFQSSQPLVGEDSISSAVGEDEPMQVVDNKPEAAGERNSSVIIDKVEEQMRDCFLQNKRRKRPRSFSRVAAAEQRIAYDNDLAKEFPAFDPNATRLRSLDLIFQFHG